jgi:hypothetical protein
VLKRRPAKMAPAAKQRTQILVEESCPSSMHTTAFGLRRDDRLKGTPCSAQVAYLGISMLGSWLILRWALKQLDPNKAAKAAVSSPCGMLL